jgi:RNA polymerase sigma-70 factor (ECF subfamily)
MCRVVRSLKFLPKLDKETPTHKSKSLNKINDSFESVRFQSDVDAVLPSLRRYALALIGDRDQADDLIASTLLRALNTKNRYSGGSTKIWLYTMFTGQHHSNQHSRWRCGTSSPIDRTELSQNPTTNVPKCPDIESALAALLDEQRRALLLVVLEGFSYGDVAEIEGVPIEIAVSRIASARSRLNVSLR